MPMQHSDDSTTRYNVKITDKALADMEAIYQYISEELKSPASAIRQYNRIADGIRSLDMFPQRIRIMESKDERLREYRRLLVDNYSVFFVISKGQNIGTLNKRAQGSMLLSSNYRRNSTYGPNIG